MSHNARVTEHKRRALARPTPAKRNPYNGLRKVVCEQIQVPYEPITAPRNRRELLASEWGGIGVTPAEANRMRTYRPTSWEVMKEAAGA